MSADAARNRRALVVRAYLSATLILGCLIAPVMPARAIEVTDFWNEFNSNGLAFRQKYVGKTVTVSGYTWLIESEVNPGYVSLTGKDTFGGMLICTVSSNASLLPLAKGKRIVVSGTIKGVGPAGIQMQPCTIR